MNLISDIQELHKNMEAHKQSGNLDVYAILNQGEGVWVWDFKREEGNSHEGGKACVW